MVIYPLPSMFDKIARIYYISTNTKLVYYSTTGAYVAITFFLLSHIILLLRCV